MDPLSDLPPGVKVTTQCFSAEQIAKLQEDPQKRVYDYTYDHVSETTLAPGEVRAILQEVRKQYLEIKTSKASDDEIRKFLLAENPSWSTLPTTHPLFWQHTTMVTTNMANIFYLLDLKEKQVTQGLSEDVCRDTLQTHMAKVHDTGLTLEEYKQKIKEEERAKGIDPATLERAFAPTDFAVSTAPVE